MITILNCPVCQSNRLKILKTHQFTFPTEEEYDPSTGNITYQYERLKIFFETIRQNHQPALCEVTCCTSCGMIFTNPRLTPDDIRLKYNAVNTSISAQQRQQHHPALKTDKRAKRIYSLIAHVGQLSQTTWDILDYGGAQGYNLLPFLQRRHHCFLLDYVPARYPVGITYLGRDLDDLTPDRQFDLILLCHTLEHVPDPMRMLTALTAHLSAQGLLYVEVPLGCWKEWEWLPEPLTHVNFFSEQAVVTCLQQTGLHIRHLSTAYQWLIYENEWCINIIGSKTQDSPRPLRYKTVHQQMHNPYYLLRRVINHPRFYANVFMRKLLRRRT